MTYVAAELSLNEAIGKLSSLPVEADHPIISLYLQIHGRDLEQRKRVRVFLDQALRSEAIQNLTETSREWEDKVRAIEARADMFLNAKDKSAFNGVALFASWNEPEIISYASYLPIQNDFHVLDFPVLGPLVALQEEYAPVCLCVFNQEGARLLEMHEGILSGHRSLEQKMYPHHKQGGCAQARFQRKHDEDAEHFFKNIAHELEQVAIKNPEIHFCLMGQKKEIPLLQRLLPEQVLRRLIAQESINGKPSDGQLIRKGLDIVKRYGSEQERREMSDLNMGRISQGFGSVTPEKVFRAINQGQVATLLVRSNLEDTGAVCLGSHTILGEYKRQSPYTGERVSLAPLREILVYETIRHNGRVQLLPPVPNGKTPRYGVLYRSRGRVDFRGN